MSRNCDFDDKLTTIQAVRLKLEAGVDAVWMLLFSKFPAHFFDKKSGNAQKFEAGMDAATQHGQEANVAKRTPTAIFRVTCKWKNIFKKMEVILDIEKMTLEI